MKVVVDTNVFVSGVFFGGPPGDVLAAWRDKRIELVVSREIFEEYVRVGERLSAAAGARYVVSGDRALLATSPYGNVAVIRPRDFMDDACP